MYAGLWKCNRTIQKMLKARGYSDQLELDDDQIDQTQMTETYEIFEKKITELCREQNSADDILTQQVLDKLTYLRQHSFTGEWLYIFFVMHKIGVTLINTYVKCMEGIDVSRAILISVPSENKTSPEDQSILTPFAVKEIIKHHTTGNKIIEHFYTDALTINILEHELQPDEFKILTKDETQEIVALLYGTVDQIPPTKRIEPTDPVAKFLGLQVGDMIKCVCSSPTAGETNRYRVCMPG